MTADPTSGRTRHDELHELTAGTLVSIVVVTIYGLLVPPTFTLVRFSSYDFSGTGPDVGEVLFGLAAGLGGLMVGVLGWVMLVERRPWRAAFRRSSSGRNWVQAFVLFAGSLLARVVIDRMDLASGLYGITGSVDDIRVWAPSDMATIFIVYFVITTGGYVIVRPIVDTRRRPAAAANLPVAEVNEA